MKIISCNMTERNILREEHCLRRDILVQNLLPIQQVDVLNSPSSLTCSSQLSRSYVKQVSSVAWPKAKRGRPRSNSYPFIRRWCPLPRVIEEDESLEETRAPGTHPSESNVSVQTVNWTENKVSLELLSKVHSLRSSLALADSSWPKVNQHCRPRSNSFPCVETGSHAWFTRVNLLSRVTEEHETRTVGEMPSMANPQAPQLQTLNWTDNKLLDKINLLRSTLSATGLSSKTQAPYQLTKPTVTMFVSGKAPVESQASGQDSPTVCERNLVEHTIKAVEEVNSGITTKLPHIRKPDSTYISLISGFTHEKWQQAHAQSSANDPEINKLATNSELKREKNSKKLKCIAFSPRKLFCSSPRQNVRGQISNSSEYIPQMGC